LTHGRANGIKVVIDRGRTPLIQAVRADPKIGFDPDRNAHAPILPANSKKQMTVSVPASYKMFRSAGMPHATRCWRRAARVIPVNWRAR